ncbi:hypothetical protein SAMN05216174_104205 [Actinokineospora iranica]|uniref:Secreted protein n=2 Tax=Actinokineospora iranica TaxID=1271860 RepID=A0A1G6PB76_9PSEU|nr:hypothetical protein SAMN05216174_104205 [Actinokineospora iranica]
MISRFARRAAATAMIALAATVVPIAFAAPAQATPDQCIRFLGGHGLQTDQIIVACGLGGDGRYDECVKLLADILPDAATVDEACRMADVKGDG